MNDANGQVYVLDYDNVRIQRFSSAGGFELEWGTLETGPVRFTDPNGIGLDDGRGYVADFPVGRVLRFNPDGWFQFVFGTSWAFGTKPGARAFASCEVNAFTCAGVDPSTERGTL